MRMTARSRIARTPATGRRSETGGAVCWKPIFDEAGEVVGFNDGCCNKSLRIYPFAPTD